MARALHVEHGVKLVILGVLSHVSGPGVSGVLCHVSTACIQHGWTVGGVVSGLGGTLDD